MAEVPVFEADERQRAAIEHVNGPMLVVAGAGTGKTTVLTQRILRLIREGHVRPDEIVALTYTNNAASQMEERLRRELGVSAAQLQVQTFHAYCDNLLTRAGRRFGVLDDKDLWIYLRRRLHELHRTHFVRAANVGQFLDDLLGFMRRCHDELVTPEDYADYVGRLEHGELPLPRTATSKKAEALRDEEVKGRCREIRDVFTTVERMLREANLGTFGHMITSAHRLLGEDTELLARERKRARFILVDEFQDANFAQIKILEKLAGEERNVFAVGDPDQAIYHFRGASSAAFQLFRRQFPDARIVSLEKNRRSTSPILKSAFAVISENPEAFSDEKQSTLPHHRTPLISAREEDAKRQGIELAGRPVEAVVLEGKGAECSDLVTTIRQMQRQARCPWSDFAVLYRSHSHRDEVALELAQQGIPFSIESMDVTDTPEVRDLLACAGAVISNLDDTSLFRVAALSQFAIDPRELRARMKALPRDAGPGSVAAALAEVQGGGAVLEAVREAQSEIKSPSGMKAHSALGIILRKFDLTRGSAAVRAVLDFVDEWEKKTEAITRTGELGELLEYLEYFREAGGAIPLPSNEENAVRLLTVHTAKGLEFKHVFMLRANAGSFPNSYRESLIEFPRELRDQDSLTQEDEKTLHQQEERRLFYVAMTRARDSLTIYAQRGRGQTDDTPAGLLRNLIKDPGLKTSLRRRNAKGFQTDLFGEARSLPATASRTGEWTRLPAVPGLHTRLSASAVETYKTCPLQFKLKRDWRIPEDVAAAVQYGAAMHRVLRAYFDSLRAGRPIADEVLVELLRDDLAQAGIQDSYQRELYQRQGVEQLRGFLQTMRASAFPEVLHVEEVFEIKLGDTTIVGRMDRVDRGNDGGVVITDYKTGRPKVQEDADESLQLSIYMLAAKEKWGYEIDRLAFYNLEGNVAVVTRRNPAELQKAEHEIEKVAASIAAGNFEPTAGRHCVFCAYRSLCPKTEKPIPISDPGQKNEGRRQTASR